MGFRFRKTVSLGKGVRLNFSKSGVSTSVGPRGASVSFGKRGTYANVGIPGTGISYRKRLDSPAAKRGGASGGRPQSDAQLRAIADIANYTGDPNFAFSAGVSDAGTITFFDKQGNEITDGTLVALLKKHPSYKEGKAGLEVEAAKIQRTRAEELRKATEAFIGVYKLSPPIESDMDFKVARSQLRRDTFVPEPFASAEPNRDAVKARLQIEAEAKSTAKTPWGRRKEISEYVEGRAEREYTCELSDWNASRQRHEANQASLRSEFERKAERQYQKRLKRMDAALSGNPSYIDWAVGKWFERCELPVEASASYAYDQGARALSIDLDLPETEDLPKTQPIQLASGKLKEKDKSQRQLKKEYVTCVLGLVVFVAANMFNISPRIASVVVSGFTQRRNNAGAISDDCVVSVRFTRSELQGMRFAEVEPAETIGKFENRLNVSSTFAMKAIEPL